MDQRRVRSVVLGALVAVGVATSSGLASAKADDETALLERYAPMVSIRYAGFPIICKAGR